MHLVSRLNFKMISKFSVNLIRLSAPIRPAAFFSTTKKPSPGGPPKKSPCPETKSPGAQAKPKSPCPEKKPRDWKLELATPCDTDKILCFINTHFLREEPLYRALIPGQKPKILSSLFRSGLCRGKKVRRQINRRSRDERAKWQTRQCKSCENGNRS